MHEAMRVVNAVRDVDVYIEQPCATYEQCLSVRRNTALPFVLDEVIDSIDAILKGAADRAMDVVNIKISKFGGLTKARQARDLCVSLGIAMTIEDSWAGSLRFSGHRHDYRRQLGGRHHYRRHCASGSQHPHRVPVHLHRLQ